jgi:hypothetical protein
LISTLTRPALATSFSHTVGEGGPKGRMRAIAISSISVDIHPHPPGAGDFPLHTIEEGPTEPADTPNLMFCDGVLYLPAGLVIRAAP